MSDSRPLPRWSLASLSVLFAAICGWAATMLPWRDWTTFAVVTSAVGLVHAVTAVLAAVGHPARASAWRWQSIVALSWLGYVSWNVAQSASYIAALYGGLGRGVAVALGLVWLSASALVVPFAVWGFVMTGGVRPRRGAKAGATLVAVLAVVGLARARAVAASDAALPQAQRDPDVIAQVLRAGLPAPDELAPRPDDARSLMIGDPAQCERAPGTDRATVLVTRLARPATVVIECVQRPTLAEAVDAVADALRHDGVRGPIQIEVVTGVRELASMAPVVDSFALRPGLDGVCERERCLAPWQLVALEMFVATMPIPVIPDLRFGFDARAVRRRLAPRTPAAGGVDGLTAIETASFVRTDDGELHRLVRMRRPGPELTPATLARAVRGAEDYVVASQGEDGRFEYRADPFAGLVSYRGFSLPRQAGTTLAMCEVARDRPRARRLAHGSLEFLASLQRRVGEVSALAYPLERDASDAALGDTALPAIAFLTCRDLVGDRYDEAIDRMTRLLLAMQRQDGGFAPRFDLVGGAAMPGPDPLYAVGQAVYALVLLEQLSAAEPGRFVDAATVHDAVERSMSYIAGPYWGSFARDFFYMEENWHCLAARAALPSHRHDGYERFCLDYVRYKRRLVLDETSEVAPDLVGGYGFGNVLMPHNTGTSGFGEALAASIAISRARGRDTAAQEDEMRLALGFLVHHQWDEVACFACSGAHPIPGAFSEHPGSPHIRIDYVQHALAAMGHGGRMLGWLE